MSNNWHGVISLVLSKSEGRLGSSARVTSTTAQSSQARTFGREAAGPNDFVNTDGRLIGDRPVVAKAQLVYQFPWGIMAAGNVQHQTGRFYSRQVRVSGLGFPTAPTINMEPNTGDRRVADVNLIDMRVQKAFTLRGSPMRLDVFLDALNLTNSDQAEGIGSVAGDVDGVRRADPLHPAAPHAARREDRAGEATETRTHGANHLITFDSQL